MDNKKEKLSTFSYRQVCEAIKHGFDEAEKYSKEYWETFINNEIFIFVERILKLKQENDNCIQDLSKLILEIELDNRYPEYQNMVLDDLVNLKQYRIYYAYPTTILTRRIYIPFVLDGKAVEYIKQKLPDGNTLRVY